MAAAKKATHTVLHPKQYLNVGGKLQHVKQGSGVVLTKEHAKADAERARPLFSPVTEGSTLKVGETADAPPPPPASDGGGEGGEGGDATGSE